MGLGRVTDDKLSSKTSSISVTDPAARSGRVKYNALSARRFEGGSQVSAEVSKEYLGRVDTLMKYLYIERNLRPRLLDS